MAVRKNPERDAARRRERTARLKELLGGKCVQCGSTEQLEFDHIDPDEKSFDVSNCLEVRWQTLLDEVAKCQLLCKMHHDVRSKEQRSVEHGGGVSGKKNCPCAPCKARKAEYMRDYEAAHRKPPAVRTPAPPPPHGTRARYLRKGIKCRCDACRAANTAYTQKLRARNLPS